MQPRQLPPDPTPALRAVLDIPLKSRVSPATTARVEAFARAVRGVEPGASWAPRYEEAIDLVNALVLEIDAQVEEIQRRAGAEDPMEIKQRLVATPRRDAERARNDARVGVQKVVREWVDRSRRQYEHVLGGTLESAKKAVTIESAPTEHGVRLTVAEAWRMDFEAHVLRNAEEWTKTFTTGADGELGSSIHAALAPLVAMHQSNALSATPTVPPRIDVRVAEEIPTKDIEVPSLGTALLHYVRTKIMAVGIFATVLGAAVAMSDKLFGDPGKSASSSTMILRGGIVLAVLPLAIYFGIDAAKKERSQVMEKSLVAQREAVRQFARAELEKVYERHRRTLERWVTLRGESWSEAADRWWDSVVEPSLARADASAGEAVREAKVAQSRLGEELNSLRAFRAQLSQNVLFELRKRHREILDQDPPR